MDAAPAKVADGSLAAAAAGAPPVTHPTPLAAHASNRPTRTVKVPVRDGMVSSQAILP